KKMEELKLFEGSGSVSCAWRKSMTRGTELWQMLVKLLYLVCGADHQAHRADSSGASRRFIWRVAPC
ncbi:hypothetical protein A2U01_0074824, partial [Trifolium medium]|nr:hypothetical protein [Trifolium medium]